MNLTFIICIIEKDMLDLNLGHIMRKHQCSLDYRLELMSLCVALLRFREGSPEGSEEAG